MTISWIDPRMRTQASNHSRGRLQDLMNATEVVPHLEHRNLMNVILQLLRERVRKERKAAHRE
jgi:hypothetical protein